MRQKEKCKKARLFFFTLLNVCLETQTNTNDVHVNHIWTKKVFDSDSVQAHPVATKLL